MAKVVVLFSGGLDSTVCLAKAIHEHGRENVIALSMGYGQKHDKELEAAKSVIAHYRVQHIEKDLTDVFTFSDCPLLKAADSEIPEGDYASQKEEQGTVVTYVPFRNGLFLSYATAIAYSLGASKVIYGAHQDDAAGGAYPDCTPQFINAMTEAIKLGTGQEVVLEAPFGVSNKAHIVKTGLELKVPFNLTWSCYNGNEKACGKCSTCQDRLKAFEMNDAMDPIAYEEV